MDVGGYDPDTLTTSSPSLRGSTGPNAGIMRILRSGGAWVDGILASVTAVVLVGCCEITVVQLRSLPNYQYSPTLRALQAQPRPAPPRPSDDLPAPPAPISQLPPPTDSTTAAPAAKPVGAAIRSHASVLSTRASPRPRAVMGSPTAPESAPPTVAATSPPAVPPDVAALLEQILPALLQPAPPTVTGAPMSPATPPLPPKPTLPPVPRTPL